jgi:O-antigen ligase
MKGIDNQRLITYFAAISVLCVLVAVVAKELLVAAIPAVLLFGYLTIVDYRILFFLLMASIPWSFEYQFPNGFSTDLPTEPLVVLLMGIYFLVVIQNAQSSTANPSILNSQSSTLFAQHPITLWLVVGFAWAIVATLNSTTSFLSIKYLLAKFWYIITFYFFTGLLLHSKRDMLRLFWWVFTPLSIAVIVTTVRHAAVDFSFKDVNYVMQPMFRNHVAYACVLSVFLPFAALGWTWLRRGSTLRYLVAVGIVLFFIGIGLSFTRAAYGAIVAAAGYFLIVRYRLTKWVLLVGSLVILGFLGFITSNNKYLDFAPKFERTITHENFDNLLSATTKGEDISSMERVYRWVAGIQMVSERPLTGFGPNSFYDNYKIYTVRSFKTYVSDNPDQSTVHCYYLLLAVEQGIFATFLFMGLIFYALLRGEYLYHHAPKRWQRQTALAALSSLVIILILITINDLIETDKIGSFFYLNLALLVNLDVATRRSERFAESE